MEFAAERHAQQHPAIPLLIRDSGAGPEASSRMVAELAGNASVLAIAGPLTGGAAKVAAEQAEQRRIPLFALSPRDGLPEIGDYIFRDSLTSPAQVRTLARHAMERQGLTDFAVLYPENALGNEMAGLFIREVRQRGGRIVATQSYGETTTDFRVPLKLLKGEDPRAPDQVGTSADEASEAGAAPRPALPFQALFIPAYADQISLIAPQLAFYGIEGVQLLGINGWNSPELLRGAGPFVQGAIFIDGFFPASANPGVRGFVDGYTAKYGAAPTILEAQGFDVANILLSLLARPEIRSRDEVRQALAQLANYPGVSGPITIGPTGEALQNLCVLRVDGAAIMQIE
jgi:ABC-type branched-subunit amino acid transport system substrate-binding protein